MLYDDDEKLLWYLDKKTWRNWWNEFRELRSSTETGFCWDNKSFQSLIPIWIVCSSMEDQYHWWCDEVGDFLATAVWQADLRCCLHWNEKHVTSMVVHLFRHIFYFAVERKVKLDFFLLELEHIECYVAFYVNFWNAKTFPVSLLVHPLGLWFSTAFMSLLFTKFP